MPLGRCIRNAETTDAMPCVVTRRRALGGTSWVGADAVLDAPAMNACDAFDPRRGKEGWVSVYPRKLSHLVTRFVPCGVPR